MSKIVIEESGTYLEAEQKIIGTDDTTISRTPRSIVDFLTDITDFSLFDTGFMPKGVRCVRTGDGWSQVTYVIEPDIHTIFWGREEGGSVEPFSVAMPWLVFVTMFKDGANTGARVFYSPKEPTGLDAPLYHTNWANVNCRGYGSGSGNGLGWVCLYHQADDKTLTFNAKLHRMMSRVIGGEPFNDHNMWSTDGARFYQSCAQEVKEEEALKFLWNVEAWEAKTQDEGLDWVLDENLWIPALVEGIDNQKQHHVGGVPLTLGMVIYGDSAFYYNEAWSKEINNASRNKASEETLTANLLSFYQSQAKRKTPSVRTIVDETTLAAKPIDNRWTQLTSIPKPPARYNQFAKPGSIAATYYCPNCGENSVSNQDDLCDDCL